MHHTVHEIWILIKKGDKAMTWYTAHYGNWKDEDGAKRIYSGAYRKEAFARAKEAADKTGKTVTVIWERPTGNGLSLCFRKFFKN